MAAIDQLLNFGRIAVLADPAVLYFTINANGATYATASGGLPIDISVLLKQGGQFDQPYINPGDVVNIMQVATPSSGGYFPYAFAFVVANCTFGPPVYPYTGGGQNSIQPDQSLLTAPATVRLYTKAGVEFSDGVCNETGITIALLVARGGTNS